MTARTKLLGALFVGGGVLFQALWLGLPAVLLSVMLVLCFGLWNAGGWRVRPSLRGTFGLGVVVFLAHVAEEYAMDLHTSGPALVDRPAWSGFRFLAFNGTWAVVFCMAAAAARPGRSLPVLVVLFFAVAGGVGNGVVHLLLAVQAGRYFPGAWTAPLCFVVGVALLRSLYAGATPQGRGRLGGEE